MFGADAETCSEDGLDLVGVRLPPTRRSSVTCRGNEGQVLAGGRSTERQMEAFMRRTERGPDEVIAS
jgi:hypothetical protein